MSTVYPANSICPASCEKSTLFRHGLLCPKIECSTIIASRIGQSIAFRVSVSKIFHVKPGITGPDFLFPNHKKWQSRNWNPIAHDTWLSPSSVNPKLHQHLEPKSDCLLSQLWIDAYSKSSQNEVFEQLWYWQDIIFVSPPAVMLLNK